MQTITREAEAEAIRALAKRGREDPVWFIERFMGAKLWPVQQQIARDVFRHRRVAVKACHSSGKTFVNARIVLAFFLLYPGCKILTTAPTWDIVERQLWGELAEAYAKLPPNMRKGLELLKTELRGAGMWEAYGLSTNEGVRFQGRHGAKMLVVMDEANGIAPDIWGAAESLGAGGVVHYLCTANPLESSGPFYDIFTSRQIEWVTSTISAFDTPNLAGLTIDDLLAMDDAALDIAVWPSLIGRRYVREMYERAGPDSPLYQSRVLGLFPEQTEDSLFSLKWLEWAATPAKDDGYSMVIAGLDVAGPGKNETVLTIRQGGSVIKQLAWSNPDPFAEVMVALDEYKDRLGPVNVDGDGIGYHLALRLRDAGYPARQIRGEIVLGVEEHYLNKRAELWFNLRDRMRKGEVIGVSDVLTQKQLLSIRYKTRKGKLAIETKEEMKSRGVASPDRADSLMLAFATGEQLQVSSRMRRRYGNEDGEEDDDMPRFAR